MAKDAKESDIPRLSRQIFKEELNVMKNEPTIINDMNEMPTTTLVGFGSQLLPSLEQRYAVFDRERENAESHQLIWLESYIHTTGESAITIAELRKIVDYTKLFDDIERCTYFIERTTNIATFIVASGGLGQVLIPKIHDQPNIKSIYIFCRSQQFHQQWASKHLKIKAVHTELHELLNDLSKDVKYYLNHERGTQFISESHEQSTTDSGIVSWWTYFIHILCKLPFPERDCFHQLVDLLKVYYSGNTQELSKIDEFERTYTPHNAIQWYTKDSFLYRLLNKALRQHNIGAIFLFVFFLKDMYRQLKHEHKQFVERHAGTEQSVIKVYRGQIMSKDEIKDLKDHPKSSFLINSFLSTSLNRNISGMYLDPRDPVDESQSVLLEIDVNPEYHSHPFANISSLSYFQQEDEVLFMIGTKVEQRKRIYFDENQRIWIAELKLADDDNGIESSEDFELANTTAFISLLNELSTVLDYATSDEINLLFDKLFDLFPTKKYYVTAIKLLCFGYYERVENPNKALIHFSEAIQLWLNHIKIDELNCLANVGRLYFGIGHCYYYIIDNKDLALDNFNLSVTYYNLAIDKADRNENKLIMLNKYYEIYKYLGDIFEIKSKINDQDLQNSKKAIMYMKENLRLMLNYRSHLHTDICTCFREIGDMCSKLGKYDEALTYYEKLLTILQSHQRKLDFLKLILCCEPIVEIYFQHKDEKYQLALNYQLLKYEYTMKYYHQKREDIDNDERFMKRDIAENHIKLAEIYTKLNKYNVANKHLQEATTELNPNEMFHTPLITKIANLQLVIDYCRRNE